MYKYPNRSLVDNIPKKTPSKDDKKEQVPEEEKPEVKEVAEAESEVFKVGERVDCRDEDESKLH